MVKFLRRDSARFSKFGKKRKKLLIWKKPKGRDNKMREKKRGYPAVVKIGYQKNKDLRGKINDKSPVLINNVKDLDKIMKNQIAILGNLGKKKKIEVVKKAKEMKIELKNINIDSFLKKEIKLEKKEATKTGEKK